MLVTRPEPGAGATAARLRASGWRPVVAPFMAVRPFAVALPPVDRIQAVVSASGNAVTLPAPFRTLPLLAVGNATAARARAAGFRSVHSADGDAPALAALAACLLDPARGALLLATGRGQGVALARALRRAGFTVHRRAVYAAAPVRYFPPEAATAVTSGLQAAVFFSTETARAFARLLPPVLVPHLCQTDAVVIGPGVADAVKHLPWRTLRVALRPTQDEVLALL